MRVPMLCYHRVEAAPAGAERDSNFVSVADFAAHMRLLASLGFHGVTVRQIARWQRGELTLPKRAVAITFDDAYVSVLENAIPILDQYGWPSTIFAVSSELGGTNAWDESSPRAALMSAATLRALAAAGHEIGSHTRHHRRIRGLDAAQARDELSGSRHDLEAVLGLPVESFAFPYGSHDLRALEYVQRAGFQAAVTLKRWANGPRGNPLRLGRMSVGGPLSSTRLALKLAKVVVTPARY